VSESATANRWREEGRAIAATLDDHASAVIIGREPEHAAEVALGIAEVQARRRRVAIIKKIIESFMNVHCPARGNGLLGASR
jgi:hypothetical protein